MQGYQQYAPYGYAPQPQYGYGAQPYQGAPTHAPTQAPPGYQNPYQPRQ